MLASQKAFRGPYRLHSATRSEPDIELALFKAIDLKDGVLIRGLYTLLKSQGLMRSDLFLFMEEAFINLQISREAALLMIRQHLTHMGRANASYKDAHDHIRTNFVLGEFLAGFFEQQYDLWIETKHPSSSFGAEWAPSITADGYYDAYDASFRSIGTSC